jgi:5-methylcytosine-specific restriction protein A
MPYNAPRPCRRKGCSQVTTHRTGFCEQHRKQEYIKDYHKRKDRGVIDSIYSSARWRKLRQEHLNDEPYCRHCARRGVVTVGTVVDHIVAINNGGGRWDEHNLQTLCVRCHNSKTNDERAGENSKR